MSSQALYPSEQPQVVVPSDADELTYGGKIRKTRAIMVAVAGDIVLKNDLNVFETVPFPVGAFPSATDHIKLTGTTATGITALF